MIYLTRANSSFFFRLLHFKIMLSQAVIENDQFLPLPVGGERAFLNPTVRHWSYTGSGILPTQKASASILVNMVLSTPGSPNSISICSFSKIFWLPRNTLSSQKASVPFNLIEKASQSIAIS